jgi:hypothetical protein
VSKPSSNPVGLRGIGLLWWSPLPIDMRFGPEEKRRGLVGGGVCEKSRGQASTYEVERRCFCSSYIRDTYDANASSRSTYVAARICSAVHGGDPWDMGPGNLRKPLANYQV